MASLEGKNLSPTSIVVLVFIAIIIAILSFFTGLHYRSSVSSNPQTNTAPTSSSIDEALVAEMGSAKQPYCYSSIADYQIGTHPSFALSDATNIFEVTENLDAYTAICNALNGKGASILSNIVFLDDQTPPYFNGYATVTLTSPSDTQSSTSTYAFNQPQVYLVAFSFSQGQKSNDFGIHQVAFLNEAKSISSLSLPDLGENGLELKLTGIDGADHSFVHYLRIGVNKGGDPFFDPIN